MVRICIVDRRHRSDEAYLLSVEYRLKLLNLCVMCCFMHFLDPLISRGLLINW